MTTNRHRPGEKAKKFAATSEQSQPPTLTSNRTRALFSISFDAMANKRVPHCPDCGVATPKKLRFTDAPSPFRDLIAVNGIASRSEVEYYLQGVHNDISAQDDTIRRIKAALTEAENERKRLQWLADSHIALTSAFRKFPPEILTQIFHLVVASPPGERPDGIKQVFKGLWNIGAVCRLWRSIVLANPSLWASFTIEDSGSRSLVSLLDTLLDRSCEVGMTIAIRGSIWREKHVLERAFCTSHRWKRAWIEFSYMDEVSYDQIRGRLPLLEQLSLSAMMFAEAFSWGDFRVFEDAPRLREVVLGAGIPPAWRLLLPWSQITSLCMCHSVEVADLRAVLSIAPNLQSLSFQRIYGLDDDWEPKSEEDIVTCVSLQNIKVHEAALFRTVNLPSVQGIDLEISEDSLDGVNDEKTWLRLQINEVYSNFERMLNSVFRLTHLDITLSSLSAATMLFQMLVLKEDKTNVLPQLQCLKAKAAEVKEPDTFLKEINLGENIVDMLVSRYRQLPNSSLTVLQSAHIDLPCIPTLFWMHLRAREENSPGFQNLISTTSENGRFLICMGRTSRLVTNYS
ncbi:uncharacterized protein BT62DRAFT_360073 [Guyanagaster necrorhizus]|uniref:F-box domain-containing protein n=1 Tax=Guyanagaster necrorhizus TaxID=856835 RepID=A0A9P7VKL1_9AGAR|nr:uncharacterized protein BT62DRAFT_360073 [Guyanagaster necrorhizus MCA 3950]KAG7442843.1 hypothetical protein BT62DRAFT_360073 [Guyanagaster necrorhizus MCA 3950]